MSASRFSCRSVLVLGFWLLSGHPIGLVASAASESRLIPSSHPGSPGVTVGSPTPSVPSAAVTVPASPLAPVALPGTPGVTVSSPTRVAPSAAANVPASPPAPVAPPELPHWVTLGDVEKGLAESLVRLLDEADQHLAALQDLKAQRSLLAAHKLCQTSEHTHLVLGMHPEWLLMKTRLAVLDERLALKRGSSQDIESARRITILARQLDALLGEVEKKLPTETLDQQVVHLNALRVRWDKVTNQPELAELPGWQRILGAYSHRLEQLESRHELTIAQGQLLEGMARIALLQSEGNRAFDNQEFEAARSHYLALEDACEDFLQAVAIWLPRGLPLAQLVYEGPEGKRKGRAYLEQVRVWLRLARERQKPTTPKPVVTPSGVPSGLPPRVPFPPILPDQ